MIARGARPRDLACVSVRLLALWTRLCVYPHRAVGSRGGRISSTRTHRPGGPVAVPHRRPYSRTAPRPLPVRLRPSAPARRARQEPRTERARARHTAGPARSRRTTGYTMRTWMRSTTQHAMREGTRACNDEVSQFQLPGATPTIYRMCDTFVVMRVISISSRGSPSSST